MRIQLPREIMKMITVTVQNLPNTDTVPGQTIASSTENMPRIDIAPGGNLINPIATRCAHN